MMGEFSLWHWIIVLVVVYFLLRPLFSGFRAGLRGSGRAGPVGRLHGPGAYGIEVVGESHYQRALEEICGGRREDNAEKHVDAHLILEDTNPHDSNAVRVDVDGKTVGYLSRETARLYRQRLKEAGHTRLDGVCAAVIRGGWDRGRNDRGHFGVWLDLPTR